MTATMTEPAVWVDATVAALHLRLAHGIEIRPATIRQWGKRGHITRRRQGLARYNLHEVVAHALRHTEGT